MHKDIYSLYTVYFFYIYISLYILFYNIYKEIYFLHLFFIYISLYTKYIKKYIVFKCSIYLVFLYIQTCIIYKRNKNIQRNIFILYILFYIYFLYI